MKRIFIYIAGLFAFLSVQAQNLVDYVNPFIGTTNFGTCNPGAIVPYGMMSVVPFNVMVLVRIVDSGLLCLKAIYY